MASVTANRPDVAADPVAAARLTVRLDLICRKRPIALIEQLTGLDFGLLRTMDRMGSVETTAPESARPIRGPEDIVF